ncbi:MAG: phosphotransferase [Rhodoferax sp.]|nr:phosphotransferase [Rhodoferax sp.]
MSLHVVGFVADPSMAHSRSMRQSLPSLLQSYGLVRPIVRHVARDDCDVYRISPGAGRWFGHDLSLRIYPAHKRDLAPIEAEVAWLRALAADGVYVPNPLPNENGTFIQQWQSAGAPRPGTPCSLTWLRGYMYDRGLTPQRLHRVGRMTGALASRRCCLGTHRRDRHAQACLHARFGAVGAGFPRATGEPDTTACGAHARCRASPDRRSGAVATACKNYGFVHGDLHQWNLVFAGGSAGAIDFSDCGWGHLALDLASTLQYLRFPLAHNHDHRWQYAPAGELVGRLRQHTRCAG